MAEFEKRLACVIAADGSIARGYMIDRCELVGANEYVITWKVPLQKEAKTNFSCVIGSAEQEMVEPGFCTVGLMADPMKMRVHPTTSPASRPSVPFTWRAFATSASNCTRPARQRQEEKSRCLLERGVRSACRVGHKFTRPASIARVKMQTE